MEINCTKVPWTKTVTHSTHAMPVSVPYASHDVICVQEHAKTVHSGYFVCWGEVERDEAGCAVDTGTDAASLHARRAMGKHRSPWLVIWATDIVKSDVAQPEWSHKCSFSKARHPCVIRCHTQAVSVRLRLMHIFCFVTPVAVSTCLQLMHIFCFVTSVAVSTRLWPMHNFCFVPKHNLLLCDPTFGRSNDGSALDPAAWVTDGLSVHL